MIEEFGSLVVRLVRDVALRRCEENFLPQAQHPVARRWKDSAVSPEAAKTIASDAVDEAVFALLNAIDEGRLHLLLKDGANRTVDLTEEGMGELGGWYMGTWRRMHSTEHLVDDFADMRHE